MQRPDSKVPRQSPALLSTWVTLHMLLGLSDTTGTESQLYLVRGPCYLRLSVQRLRTLVTEISLFSESLQTVTYASVNFQRFASAGLFGRKICIIVASPVQGCTNELSYCARTYGIVVRSDLQFFWKSVDKIWEEAKICVFPFPVQSLIALPRSAGVN
jgi:hypothetical protein